MRVPLDEERLVGRVKRTRCESRQNDRAREAAPSPTFSAFIHPIHLIIPVLRFQSAECQEQREPSPRLPEGSSSARATYLSVGILNGGIELFTRVISATITTDAMESLAASATRHSSFIRNYKSSRSELSDQRRGPRISAELAPQRAAVHSRVPCLFHSPPV